MTVDPSCNEYAVVVWKDAPSWLPLIDRELRPYLRRNWRRRLGVGGLSEDDRTWQDLVEDLLRPSIEDVEDMASQLLCRRKIRTYHGCRSDDARSYLQRGIVPHDRVQLMRQLGSIVARFAADEPLRECFAQHIVRLEDRGDFDFCHVVVDDRALIERGAHYLIYGSEWLASVLGDRYRNHLKKIGSPTIIDVDFPLSAARPEQVVDLGRDMLQEWIRQLAGGPETIPILDFTISHEGTIPSEWVVGHWHPARMRDPFESYQEYLGVPNTCRACVEQWADESA